MIKTIILLILQLSSTTYSLKITKRVYKIPPYYVVKNSSGLYIAWIDIIYDLINEGRDNNRILALVEFSSYTIFRYFGNKIDYDINDTVTIYDLLVIRVKLTNSKYKPTKINFFESKDLIITREVLGFSNKECYPYKKLIDVDLKIRDKVSLSKNLPDIFSKEIKLTFLNRLGLKTFFHESYLRINTISSNFEVLGKDFFANRNLFREEKIFGDSTSTFMKREFYKTTSRANSFYQKKMMGYLQMKLYSSIFGLFSGILIKNVFVSKENSADLKDIVNIAYNDRIKDFSSKNIYFKFEGVLNIDINDEFELRKTSLFESIKKYNDKDNLYGELTEINLWELRKQAFLGKCKENALLTIARIIFPYLALLIFFLFLISRYLGKTFYWEKS